MQEVPRQQLKEALEALHEELESGEGLGDDDRDALLEAAREIEAALGAATAAQPPESGPLSSRISTLIEDFEASHPRFAEILANVSEALANLGI
jgi:hypothetical protein